MRTRDLLVVCGLTTAGCGELPGQVVGTYKIEMTLDENTCGALAVNSLDGHRYAVELRADGERGFWRIPGQPPLEGTYVPPAFHFEYSSIVASSDADAGPYGCQLRQSEVLEGSILLSGTPGADGGDETEALDAGADADAAESAALDAGAATSEDATGPALQGSHEMTIEPARGTDCREALAPEGAFEHLPCSVRYTLRGKPHSAF
jgi:hypothetical protein